MGDPTLDETDMGPVRTPAVLARTKAHIADAVDKGATVVLGGGSRRPGARADDDRRRHLRHADRAGGDVRPGRSDHDVRDAGRGDGIANETDYGLTASVFTRPEVAWTGGGGAQHGTVHINETTNYWDQMAPFGGAKKSGSGRELGRWILDAMSETKQITWELG